MFMGVPRSSQPSCLLLKDSCVNSGPPSRAAFQFYISRGSPGNLETKLSMEAVDVPRPGIRSLGTGYLSVLP